MKNGSADLKTIRVIRQNHRFVVSEVDWLGERVFLQAVAARGDWQR